MTKNLHRLTSIIEHDRIYIIFFRSCSNVNVRQCEFFGHVHKFRSYLYICGFLLKERNCYTRKSKSFYQSLKIQDSRFSFDKNGKGREKIFVYKAQLKTCALLTTDITEFNFRHIHLVILIRSSEYSSFFHQMLKHKFRIVSVCLIYFNTNVAQKK